MNKLKLFFAKRLFKELMPQDASGSSGGGTGRELASEILGRIVYKDKSEFDIEQGELDVSGIYGSKLLKEESISGIPIKLYTYEDTIYGIWTYEDYSYSYSMLGSDPDNLNIEINKIISLIR